LRPGFADRARCKTDSGDAPWPADKFGFVLKRQRQETSVSALLIRNKALGQAFRIRQRDEMATGNFLHLLSEPFTRDTPLKFDREKAIVSSRKNMNGDIRPALEATGLAENGLCLLAWPFRTGAQHIQRHVVQKVCFHIKFRRIATARRSLFPRLGRSRRAPPCASGLARLWNHRVDKHHHPHRGARANEGCREPRQRLSDENNVASFRDRADDDVSIRCETGVSVVAR